MSLRKSLIKLTLGYMLLIMIVSGSLSYAIYRGGARPLERRIEMDERIFEDWQMPIPPPDQRFRQFEPQVVNDVKREFATFLIIFNLAVLGLGGLASYLLARRELKPMETALELQSRFTSDAAHELRTPLTAMKTEIEVALRGKSPPTGETRELLESNLEEIGKLEALSASLLKLAQYEEGLDRSAMGALDVEAIVDEAVERVSRSASARQIAIEKYLEAATVSGDRVSLVEMLVIFLDNSIKYSPDNTRITIASRVERRHVVLSVSDQGYGIEQEELSHVFDRFYRARLPGSNQKIEGYGLGLSIALRIAEVNRVSIEIESAPGQGTTVSATLPMARERRAPGTEGGNAAPETREPFDNPPPTSV